MRPNWPWTDDEWRASASASLQNLALLDGGLADQNRRLGALLERMRVMRILRELTPHGAAQNNEMARLCVEMFRIEAMEAVNVQDGVEENPDRGKNVEV